MKVEYQANNSGGKWWLIDSAWDRLRNAGWEIQDHAWILKEHERMMNEADEKKEGMSRWADRRIWWKPSETGEYRYMGALATKATKDFPNIQAAIAEFEKLTGADVTTEGCNCCGAPHSFTWGTGGDRQHASGESLLEFMYKNIPSSFREAVERLNERNLE